MKPGHRDIDKDGKGSIAMTPEEPEDMWHAYNIIQEGDHLRASTIRKIINESATGSTTSNKIRLTLTIRIEQIEYDTQASVLRVKGRNVVESTHVKIGQYHTLDIELNRKFTLFKEKWDSIALERFETACDASQKADVAAVVMQEGLAHVILVTPFTSLTKAKIETNVPRKRKGHCSQHEKGLQKFYENLIQAIIRHVNFEVVKSILIASPGFVKDHFFDFMMAFATRNDIKVLIENKGKFLLAHSSSGFKHSLKEILADPVVQSKLVDTKAASEVKALEKFHQLLATEPDRAYYGVRHVEKANEFQAIETLLISDTLFRSNNLQERKRYVDLVDAVRANDGEVKIFSSLHTTGEQLDQLTGLAAILRFPVPQVEEEIDLSSTSSSDMDE